MKQISVFLPSFSIEAGVDISVSLSLNPMHIVDISFLFPKIAEDISVTIKQLSEEEPVLKIAIKVLFR